MEKQERIVYQLPGSSSEVDWRIVTLSENGIELKLYQTTDPVEDETYLNGYIQFNNYSVVNQIEFKQQFLKYFNRFLEQVGGLEIDS